MKITRHAFAAVELTSLRRPSLHLPADIAAYDPLGPLHTVCAWCHGLVHLGALPVSHGICEPCRTRLEVA